MPALLGSLLVLIANLLLRPVARLINRSSKAHDEASELVLHYLLRVVCLSEHETHIRSLLLQNVSGNELILQALQSQDTTDMTRVEVRAEVQTEGRKDAQLEQIVARLSLESSVSSVRWEVALPETGAASLLERAQPEVQNLEEE